MSGLLTTRQAYEASPAERFALACCIIAQNHIFKLNFVTIRYSLADIFNRYFEDSILTSLPFLL